MLLNNWFFIGEADYDDDPDATGRDRRRNRAIVKKEKKEYVRKPRVHHSKLIDELHMDSKESNVKETPSASWQHSLRPVLGEVKSRLLSASSQKMFLSSAESTEIPDRRSSTKNGSQEGVDARDDRELEQKRHFEEKLPTSSRTKDRVNKMKMDQSRTPVSISSQESLGDIPEYDIYTREEAPFLELQQIIIPEEDEEAPEEPLPERRSRLSSDDIQELQSLQRLPVTSAYTFSFYDLPRQHRQYNDKINKSAKSIGSKRRGSVK